MDINSEHRNLTNLYKMLGEINDNLYHGEVLLSKRLLQHQTPESVIEVQNYVSLYRGKKMHILEEIVEIQRNLGAIY